MENKVIVRYEGIQTGPRPYALLTLMLPNKLGVLEADTSLSHRTWKKKGFIVPVLDTADSTLVPKQTYLILQKGASDEEQKS